MQSIKLQVILFILLLKSSLSFSETGIFAKRALNQDFIGSSVYLFQDTSHSLTLQKVKESDFIFKKSYSKVPNFGISSNTNWIKFSLFNNSNITKFILNLSNPIIDEVTLYIVRDKKIDSIHYTNYYPLKNRTYKHQFYLFNIALKKGESVNCYLKLKSNQQILVPLSLRTEKQIFSETSNADAKTGLYLGIMLVMLLYNLFIYFIVKDKDYLVYCHYIFWVALTQATLLGFFHRFLWTGNIWLAQHMIIFCGAMSGIATVLFAKSFLRASKYTPKLNILLNVIIIVYLLAIIALLLDKHLIAFQMVNATAGVGSLLVIYVAWSVYKKKYAPASYFLLSFSIFFISVLIFVFKDYGIVPYNQLTVHSVEIGSALEAIFLSFALAGKINILKKEKEASQAEALLIAEENERIIKEQNVILEKKVNERTIELISTNDELSDTLEDLKEAQSQLVAAEKMASLGQLTAGIAHEINNPINFVTSNVSPLTRDVDMLLDAIKVIEEVGLSDISIPDKEKKIADYKEELDFDYLKIEINHLLKGINEGASRTAEIVKGLRIFSRVDEDDLKRADINEGIESTLVIVNNLLGKIEVKRDFGKLPLIECYPGKLNQVFLNILSNAVYATQKHFGENEGGEIKIITTADDENVMITFKDNGIGMDEITMQKIFEPFFTTKEVGEGTGLGMSIAYNTIKKHNGEIIIHSKIGEGTEFILKLPIINISSNLSNDNT